MGKPKYTRPDANQKQIEQYLQQLGFWTYRTANDGPQLNIHTQNVFHPLDLLVLGRSRITDRAELTLWEIKTDDKASFTEPEKRFLSSVPIWFDCEVAVGVATDLNDILAYYGWIDK